MVEAFDNSQEARRGLLQEVTSLRKQSVIALILAILFILITVYLYIQLERSKEDLTESYARLEAQNDSITKLKNLLSDFREQYLKKNAPAPVVVPPTISSGPKPYTNSNGSIKAITKAAARQSFFGYIIYIQDRQGSNVSVALQQTLKDRGAIVPAIEHMSNRVKFRNAVKYFHPEDKGMAYNLQELMLSTPDLKAKSYTEAQLPVQFIASKKVPLGQLEVWIDL